MVPTATPTGVHRTESETAQEVIMVRVDGSANPTKHNVPKAVGSNGYCKKPTPTQYRLDRSWQMAV